LVVNGGSASGGKVAHGPRHPVAHVVGGVFQVGTRLNSTGNVAAAVRNFIRRDGNRCRRSRLMDSSRAQGICDSMTSALAPVVGGGHR
jgi:hypothetical protein